MAPSPYSAAVSTPIVPSVPTVGLNEPRYYDPYAPRYQAATPSSAATSVGGSTAEEWWPSIVLVCAFRHCIGAGPAVGEEEVSIVWIVFCSEKELMDLKASPEIRSQLLSQSACILSMKSHQSQYMSVLNAYESTKKEVCVGE